MHGGHHHQIRGKVARKVAIVSGIANLILALLKTIIGYLAQSQALIADGLHSFSDLASDVIVWFAALKASEAPDNGHPYGHQRFETAATLVLAALLLLVGFGIIWDAIEHFFSHNEGKPDAIALYIAVLSIIVKEALYWYTILAARQIHSDMLKANAWHHRSDAISSIIVFIGVGGALMDITWLDGAAAIGVGLMIGHIAWQLGRSALDELVDSALPEAEIKIIREQILNIDGVRSIHLLRTRRSANIAHIDVHVLVSPKISVSEGHMIGSTIEWQLKQNIDDNMDITVHIDSEDDEINPTCQNLPLRSQVIEKLKTIWADLGCIEKMKSLDLHYYNGKIDLTIAFDGACYQNKDHAKKHQQLMQQSLQNQAEFGKVVVSYHFSDITNDLKNQSHLD